MKQRIKNWIKKHWKGLAGGLAACFVASPAFAFNAVQQGDMFYDLYDLVFNKGIAGVPGVIGAGLMCVLGAKNLVNNDAVKAAGPFAGAGVMGMISGVINGFGANVTGSQMGVGALVLPLLACAALVAMVPALRKSQQQPQFLAA